jgi:hypothetical protein
MQHQGELVTESATVRNNMGKSGQDRQLSATIKYFDNQNKINGMEWTCSKHREITNTGSPNMAMQ